MKNSVSSSLRDSKGKIKKNLKHNEINSYDDKILKNFFLNNLDRISKKNKDLVKNLNTTFRNYELNLNQKDVQITNNLFQISANRVLNMKNEIKKSDRLLRQYEEQYGFNSAINNKLLLSETKEKEDNSKNSLSRSDISKKNKKENLKNNISIDSKEEKETNFKRFSVNFNYKTNMKKYMKIILNEKKHEKKLRRVEQLTELFSAVETVEKKEVIDDNKYFKVEKINFIPFYRDKLKNKKRIDFNYVRNRNKLKRNKTNFLSEEKLFHGSDIHIFSNAKSEENMKKNNININKNINENKKIKKIILL